MRQVLRLDIRSVHQRTSAHGRLSNTSPSALSNRRESAEEQSAHQHFTGSGDRPSEGGQSLIVMPAQAHEHDNPPRGSATALEQPMGLNSGSSAGRYSVVLQGVTVSYDVLTDGTVVVRGALENKI